ncbi:MAG: class I SAM-dependent methyltransferase [Syntrophorhabdales bacterium]|jgi:SAM-dependent methyltransferase
MDIFGTFFAKVSAFQMNTGYSIEEARLAQRFCKELPAGPEFATRRNFESGYLAVEQRLVGKYLKKRSSVVVVGAGNGPEARPIASDGHLIVCFDVGFLYVRSGAALCEREKLGNVHFLQADMHALPFAHERFDFVFFSIYPMAGGRRFEVVCQIRKVLRPGGIMLLMTPTPLYPQRFPWRPSQMVILTDGEMPEEIMNVEACGFRFRESSIDEERAEYRFAVFEAC